jgi:hypothetical protein
MVASELHAMSHRRAQSLRDSKYHDPRLHNLLPLELVVVVDELKGTKNLQGERVMLLVILRDASARKHGFNTNQQHLN